MKPLLLLCMLLATLAGCSPDPDNTPRIAEDQREALEKARGVQETLNQGAEHDREEIDRQGE